MNERFEKKCDVCVIGGGFAGICAAISAARHGASVTLIHDRPVLGGNASSEIRMWPMGAHGKNNRETGIFEEIILDNMSVNPTRIYPLWDAVLYQKVKGEKNIDLMLNTSVTGGQEAEGRIVSVDAWQLTTYKSFRIFADVFIDCSGDGIVSTFSSAKWRQGREARSEYNEEAAPVESDSCTMGNSCLLQARETGRKVDFTPPKFIRKIKKEELIGRPHGMYEFRDNNFWWLELGGTKDCLRDGEEIRDDLVALSYGTWDYIKNSGEEDAGPWELDFAGWLPGKRESRRYIGKHVLTQNEVQAGGHFDDVIAFGGWKIDDHPPKGFDNFGVPTRYFDCPSPFGIPYGCIVSENVENLMFAGRNISATHAAMAASRVMGTCALLGQAAGTAAAIAIKYGITPEKVGKERLTELQQTLMEDDCRLPGKVREISGVCRNAELDAKYEPLRNGYDRPEGENDNGVRVALGEKVTYRLKKPEYVSEIRFVFDSDLDRDTVKGGIQEVRDCPTLCNRPKDMEPYEFQTTMTSDFDVLIDGKPLESVRGNRQRLVRLKVGKNVGEIAFVPLATTGDEKAHVFSFDFR